MRRWKICWDIEIAIGGLYFHDFPVLPVVIVRRFKVWIDRIGNTG